MTTALLMFALLRVAMVFSLALCASVGLLGAVLWGLSLIS